MDQTQPVLSQADRLHHYNAIHSGAMGIVGMFSKFLPRDNPDSDQALHHLILMMEHVGLALGIEDARTQSYERLGKAPKT